MTVENQKDRILKLVGPVVIFGAGGFVGFNLLQKLLQYRTDIFGVFSDPKKNWRLKELATPPHYVVKCDLLSGGEVKAIISRIKPKTVFNLAAYGAYSTQQDIDKTYQTNFNSTYLLIEELKKHGFVSYIHAGSQSEYGFNSAGPSEEEQLMPNSHYAVSKAADYCLMKYYGKAEKLPVVHLRFYSAYGPWEEPNRLIPTLIKAVKKGRLPKFVDPDISRDFIYIEDVIEAMILIALKLKSHNSNIKSNPNSKKSNFQNNLFGEVFNICTGKKTTIRELAYLAKKIFKIKQKPVFGTMKNRNWDLKDWYGNPKKTQKVFGWKAKIDIEEGLKKLNKLKYAE